MVKIKPKKGPYNPQKASAYVGKGVLKGGGKIKVNAGGEKHVIYKSKKTTSKAKKGDIMVNHPTIDKGKWDTINLTKMGKAKTVKQGVTATKKWHKAHPYKKKK